jgi:hypothetical protein
MRGAKLERAIRVKITFDHLHNNLKLLQAVLYLLLSTKLWIPDKLSFKCLTMPNLVSH